MSNGFEIAYHEKKNLKPHENNLKSHVLVQSVHLQIVGYANARRYDFLWEEKTILWNRSISHESNDLIM